MSTDAKESAKLESGSILTRLCYIIMKLSKIKERIWKVAGKST